VKRTHTHVCLVVCSLLIGVTHCALADDAAKDSIEIKCFKNIRQITFDFAKAGEGYFSRDGRSIIFQAVPREYMFYQIYTLELPSATPAGMAGVEVAEPPDSRQQPAASHHTSPTRQRGS
jgi:TolB protein